MINCLLSQDYQDGICPLPHISSYCINIFPLFLQYNLPDEWRSRPRKNSREISIYYIYRPICTCKSNIPGNLFLYPHEIKLGALPHPHTTLGRLSLTSFSWRNLLNRRPHFMAFPSLLCFLEWNYRRLNGSFQTTTWTRSFLVSFCVEWVNI